MFPTSSYNTPHGYQFGREAAEFTEENGINPALWDEALTERAYEQTPNSRESAQSERISEASEHAQLIATTQVEAQSYASPAEREYSREQSVREAHELANVGKYVRRNRDFVRSDYATAS